MRIASLLLCLTAGLFAQPDALRHRSVGASNHPLNLSPSILRSEPVELELGTLQPGSRVPFVAFDGQRFGVRMERAEAQNDARIWQGAVEGEPYSEVIVVAYGKVISGHIRRGDGRIFELITLEGALFLRELRPERGPVLDDVAPAPGGDEPAPAKQSTLPRLAESCAPNCDDGSVVDILIAYTEQFRVIRGGREQVEALIREAIAGTNASFERSGVPTRLRLVHTAEVQFQPSNNLRTDLGRVWDPADGVLDEIHAWRRHYGADLVSLWVGIQSGGASGVAYLGNNRPADESLAFSVVAGNFAISNFTFAHEIGHNFGAQHDRLNATSRPFVDYAYGFQNLAAGSDRFRTIMAYECAGAPCLTIPYFSTPRSTYQNLRVGDGGADNGRAFTETRVTLARYLTTTESPATTITVAPQTVSLPAAGGTAVVNVTANGDWKAFSALPWVTVSPSAGTGNGRVTLTVTANTGAVARSGRMMVGPFLVSVSQAGSPVAACPTLPIAVDSTVQGELSTCGSTAFFSYNFTGSAGQQLAIELSSSQFDPSLSLSGPPGYRGPFSGTTLVDANDDYAGGTNSRVPNSANFLTLPVNGLYTISVSNAGIAGARGRFVLTVRSNPDYCRFTLPAALRFEAGSGALAVNLGAAAGCGWNLTSSASWIGLSVPEDRRGAAAITLRVEPNPEGTLRTGEVVLTSAVLAAPVRLVVTQAAGAACATEDLPLDSPLDSAIGASACPSLNRGPAFPAKRFQWLGKAGQRFTVTARSADFDPYVSLITSSGALVAASDQGRLGSQDAPLRLAAGGLYFLEVSGFEAGLTGRFNLEVSTKVPPPPVEAAPLLFDLPNALELPAVTEGTLFSDRLFEFEVPANAVGLEFTGTVTPGSALVALHLRANEPPVLVDGQVQADATVSPTGDTGALALTLSADTTPALRSGKYYLAVSQTSPDTPATLTLTPRLRRPVATSFQLVDQLMTATPATVCGLPASRADNFRPADRQAAFVFTGIGQRGGVARVQFLDPTGAERVAVSLPAAVADGDYCGQALLPIAGTAQAAALGRWKAKLFWDGEEVFSRTFVLSDTAVALPPALTLGQAQSLTLEPVALPMLLNRTAVYRVAAPAGVSRLVFRLATQTAGVNLDLYIRAGVPPASNGSRIVADFLAEGATGEESLTIDRALSLPKLEDGTVYYVAVAQRTPGVATRATLTVTAITDPAVITRSGMEMYCQANASGQTEITPSIGRDGRPFPVTFSVMGTARLGTVFSFEFVTPRGQKVQAQSPPPQAFDGAFCANGTLELAGFTPFDWTGTWQALLSINGAPALTHTFSLRGTTPPAVIPFSGPGVSYLFLNPRSGLYPTQFLLKVPEGTRQLTLALRSKSSFSTRIVNLDLYVQRGSPLLGLQQSTASAVSDAPDETLTLTNPAAGDYYVGIGSPAAYNSANISIFATFTGGAASGAGLPISAEAIEDLKPVKLR